MNNISNNGFSSIEQVAGQLSKKSANVSINSQDKVSFQDILNQKKSIAAVIDESKSTSEASGLKFSKHAGERLADRNIKLTEEQMQRLEDGVFKAGKKGINESLVLMDDMAFIVNVKNSTVVTAMSQSSNEENIYTNIDGAVVI